MQKKKKIAHKQEELTFAPFPSTDPSVSSLPSNNSSSSTSLTCSEFKSNIINNNIFQIMINLKEPLHNRQSCIIQDGQVVSTIYPVVAIKNFLIMETFSNVKSFLNSIPFDLRYSDMYRFRQSMDLLSYIDHNQTIKQLRMEMFSPLFLSHLERLFELEQGSLEENVGDMSAQSYLEGDYLLCHDDRLDTRQIAFVLYLVDEDFSNGNERMENDQYRIQSRNSIQIQSRNHDNNELKKDHKNDNETDNFNDGGALEFFITDDLNRPLIFDNENNENHLNQLIYPKKNMLILFRVSMISFHQVQEVLKKDKNRLAISGWYHHRHKKIINEIETIDTINESKKNYKKRDEKQNQNQKRKLKNANFLYIHSQDQKKHHQDIIPKISISLNDEKMKKCHQFTLENNIFNEYFYYQSRIELDWTRSFMYPFFLNNLIQSLIDGLNEEMEYHDAMMNMNIIQIIKSNREKHYFPSSRPTLKTVDKNYFIRIPQDFDMILIISINNKNDCRWLLIKERNQIDKDNIDKEMNRIMDHCQSISKEGEEEKDSMEMFDIIEMFFAYKLC